MRAIRRLLLLLPALVLLLSGGLALGMAFASQSPAVGVGRDVFQAAMNALVSIEALSLPEGFPQRADAFLGSILGRFALAPLGLVLLIAALLPGGRKGELSVSGEEDAEPELRDERIQVDKKALRKARKQASVLAKKGHPLEAAEYAFATGLLEEAAKFFIDAGEPVRAAEIRHDQNRFVESAELYLKAGRFESAGSIFSQQEEFGRAGEAYFEAGNHSVAAEMFERAEEHARAATCYDESGFPRHAAKNYVKCEQWANAARCLELSIVEESHGGAIAEPSKRAEIEKLVRMAGNLYKRAGDPERAQAVLTRGECYGAAAELALENGHKEEAADLFLKGAEPTRAAEVLRALGRDEDAARILAEYHRDRGDEAEAARHFEEAGDLLAAGDIHRLMEQYEKAGDCYERAGDPQQAAEMFRYANERERAAENYERAGQFADAAECWALVGDAKREAELLAKAGEFLKAGELQLRSGEGEAALRTLQEIDSDHADFAAASALLGEMFRERGMLSLAQKKLQHATHDQDLTRDNVRAFYGLATVYEAAGNPTEALELYEKILAFDYHYEDVDDRLAKVREAAKREKAQSDSSRAGPLTGTGREGRYRIVGKLGRGGMGIVYKAEDTVLDRVVAFKVLPEQLKENPQALKNFLREAKSAAQLNHPNIVTVFDAGEQDGVYYIAMEYVDGNTLKEIIKHKGQISVGGIVHVLSQMAEALAYAHEKKIVHRDVKTANAMWTRDRKAKIMDFGLAKVIEEVRNHTTVVSGTPYYMSPEQTLGKNVDHRTDIYSLGVTIFEMATGTLPFREGNLPYHHVHTPPPDPREFVEDLPDFLVNIIARCLRKDPADRYQSARDILEDLKSTLGS